MQPNVVGLDARVVLYDELVVANRTLEPVVIFDRDGGVLRLIPPGKSFAWHDRRVVASRGQREGGADPGRVKNWRIPGRAGTRWFAIEGFLGYAPPADGSNDDGGVSLVWLVVATAGLFALAGACIYVMERRRA